MKNASKVVLKLFKHKISSSCLRNKNTEQKPLSMTLGFAKGFTLIELLVVVLIIGILSAVALPQYRKAVLKSRFATIKNLARSLADAQNIYYMANGEFAHNLDDLDIQFQNIAGNQADYPWGYCYVACEDSSCGGCVLEENGVSQIGYFYQNFLAYQTKCFVYPTSPQDYVDICKAETGKNNGYQVNNNIMYDY